MHPDAQEIIDALEDNRDWWLKQIPDSPNSSENKNKIKEEDSVEAEEENATDSREKSPSGETKPSSAEGQRSSSASSSSTSSSSTATVAAAAAATASSTSSSSAAGPPERIQFQMTLHEEDEENVDEKDQVRKTKKIKNVLFSYSSFRSLFRTRECDPGLLPTLHPLGTTGGPSTLAGRPPPRPPRSPT